MTREEAIAYGKRVIDLGLNDETQAFCEMAIKALEQEPCEDTISRQAVLDINANYHGQMPNHINHQIWQEIKDLPSVTPQPKKGRWINAYPDTEPNPMFMYGTCSVCGFEQAISNKLNFCPNCGAKMELKSEV